MPDNSVTISSSAPTPGATVLPSPQVVKPVLTSKTLIGLAAVVFSMLTRMWPNVFPAALQPILESGLNTAVELGGVALAAYGRFTAQGPLGWIMGGGMSDVRQLQAQVEALTQLVAEAKAELARKK